jgi:hypothetical protein
MAVWNRNKGWKLEDMRVTVNYTFGKDMHWKDIFN